MHVSTYCAEGKDDKQEMPNVLGATAGRRTMGFIELLYLQPAYSIWCLEKDEKANKRRHKSAEIKNELKWNKQNINKLG